MIIAAKIIYFLSTPPQNYLFPVQFSAGSALVVSPPPPRRPASGEGLAPAERGLVACYHAGATAVIASGVGAVGHAAKGDDAGSAGGRQAASGRPCTQPGDQAPPSSTPAVLTHSCG